MSKAQKSITSFFLPKSNPSKSNEDTNKDDVPKKKLETKNKVEKRKSEEIKNKTPKKFKKDIKLDTISHQQNNISSKKELNKEKLPESEDDDDEWINSKKSKNKILDSDDEDAEEPKNREKSVESPMETTAASSSSESKKNTIPLRKTAARPKKASFEVEKKSPKKEKSEKGAENEKKDTKNNKIIEKEIKDKIKETKTEKTLNGHTSVDDNKQNDKKTLKTEKTRKKEEDDLLYNPSIANYHPINNACWLQDEKVPFIALARTFEEIENTSSRLKTAEILSNLLRSIILLSPQDLSPSLHLCLNRLGPSYEGLELGVGDNLLMKVVAQATGRSMDRIKADVQQKGDLGLVAESSRTTQKTMFKTSKLTVNQVFSKLKLVAAITGHSSTNKKTDSIKHLFVSCRGSEARYLMRSLAGKLRIGLAEQTLLMALAQAFVMHHQYAQDLKELSGEALKKKVDEATAIIKTAYCECPNLTSITDSLLKHPLHELPQHCSIKPGIPLKPMLAHPTKGVHEVMARFEGGEFVCEFKYDGERAQIHMEDGGRKVQIFSRNQENNTTKYPDVIALVQQLLNGNDKVTSAILDAEVVAWDSDKKQILPFQVLSTRKRKDESLESIKVGVCVFAFDLLYLNGEALVRKTLRERRQMFKHLFEFVEGKFSFAKCLESSSTEEIAEFLEESIKGDCEGLMVKSLDKDATYEIAKRSHNWLKLKKDYLEGVGDTIDLVVMGGYHGSGKRAGKFGGFLLGCYDDENEDYQSICKIGTGFSDADLDQHNTFFNEKIIDTPKSYYRHDSSQTPDKWFEACQVWEVKAADLSLSPVYQAAMGLVDSNKGISLRFPRFIRVRDDKKPEDATTSSQIAQMYRSQDQIVNQMKSKKRNEEEEDEY